MCATDLTCVNATIWLVLRDCFLGLTYGFLNKNFQEIKLFICQCSFITLAQKTTMRLQIVRFLETFRRALSWIETFRVVFVHVPYCIPIHFLIRYLPFILPFILLLKKWPYLKNERVLLYSKTDRLVGFSSPSLSFFFLVKKVVSCCINVYICSKRLDYSY